MSFTPYFYRAEVVSVTDGDTVKVLLDLGIETYKQTAVRLEGINCPESRGAEPEKSRGLEAKAFVKKLLPPGTRVWVHSMKYCKYSRVIGAVYLDEACTDSLSDRLRAAGHVKA